ncbi:MAG TPA: aldehyde dehydrogenase family protein [Desulfomonilaceae bacterium]|nr:aldehyde dehydrogenase family protein [Desulfomonilaceae bacterium]
MILEPILIDGGWESADSPVGSFQSVNPALKASLPEAYPVSSLKDVERALAAAHQAVEQLPALPVGVIADFLDRFAENIEADKAALVETAHTETALPREPRLASVELPRTTDQLRQAARAVRDRSWCMATIDTRTNIRSKYAPLGAPVAVFGPNNFPFAFNSCAGGDFAAAVAAGNPVIAKANTGHPGTTRLFAEAARKAIQASGLPRAMVQLIYRLRPDDGFRFVAHPLLGATGFTGSRAAGLKLKAAAESAGKPVYLEMGSLNPVIILPGALEERMDQVVDEFFNSCTTGVGQLCTKPGLIVLLDDARGREFCGKASRFFEEGASGVLLGEDGPQNLAAAIETMTSHGAEPLVGGSSFDAPGYSFQNSLLQVSGGTFLANSGPLQTEAFGPVSLVVKARDEDELVKIVEKIEGNLTGCVYSHSAGKDDEFYNRIEPLLRRRVGRLLNDKMPTGVAVSPAMNHGGPYPATGHPGFTAVGIPASMLRFAALHCYDNVRKHRLPMELQDKNPTGQMWRSIDREWTQGDI